MSGSCSGRARTAELIFMDVYWPAFRKIDLLRAIRTFQKRPTPYGEVTKRKNKPTACPDRREHVL